MSRSQRLLALAAAVAALALALWESLTPLDSTDTDLWWHLADGRLVSHLGRLPMHDPFSYTGTVTWIAYAWLWEVLTWHLYRLGGLDALIWLRSALVLANTVLACDLVRRRLRGRDVAPAAASVAGWAAAAFIAVLASFRYLIRPDLLGYTLTLIFFWLFFEYRDGRLAPSKFLVAAAAVTAFWVNIHASWPIVPGILLLDFGSGAGRRLLGWAPREEGRWRWSGLAAAACFAAARLNPQGAVLMFHPFDFLGANLFTRTLVEHRPADLLHDLVPGLQILLLLEIALVPWLVRGRRLFEGGVLGFLTFMTLHAVRHVTFLAYFLLPIAAEAAAPLLKRIRIPWPRPVGIAAVGAAAVLAGLILPSRFPVGRCIQWETFPIDAAAFIEANHLPGPMFNPFEWGGYLIWALPSHRVFMDGRCATIYSDQTYLDYLNVIEAGRRWEKLLDAYGVNLVLLNKMFPSLGLPAAIARSPQWRLVYQDEAAWVYLRRGPAGAPAFARLARGARLPQSPFTWYARGADSLRHGRWPAAVKELQEAVQGDAYNAPAWVDLGAALAGSGRLDAARAAWRRALAVNPQAVGAHYSLGVYYRGKGDAARARAEFRAEVRVSAATSAGQAASAALKSMQ